jgi:DNA-binding transcriptional ArsR family regulator
MDHNISRQPVPERVGIYGTDDNRLRALGEVLITDVSRSILKLLFENIFTANDIAIKTGYSLQLVRYHLKKMQDVDLIEISKIGKNTKSHDMKYYTATKFAIVIVPSRFSDKAKSSKSLLRSIKSLYRLGATGIAATGAWFATLALQGTARISNTPVGTPEVPSGSGYTSYNPFYNTVGGPYSGDGGIGSGATLEEMLKLARAKVTAVTQTPHAGAGVPFIGGPIPVDIFWPIVMVVTVVAFGVSIELVLRVLKIRYKT